MLCLSFIPPIISAGRVRVKRSAVPLWIYVVKNLVLI
jgi:hypothetical protein